MNITYHHRALGDGAEGVHISEIVRMLRKEGHEVEVVSPVGEATNAPGRRANWIAGLRRRLRARSTKSPRWATASSRQPGC